MEPQSRHRLAYRIDIDTGKVWDKRYQIRISQLKTASDGYWSPTPVVRDAGRRDQRSGETAGVKSDLASVRFGIDFRYAVRIVGGVAFAVAVDVRSEIALIRTPRARDKQSTAIGIHSGAVGLLSISLTPCRTSRDCTGRSWINDEAIANVSARASGLSGILPMLRARHSIAAVFGILANRAASVQGSCQSRARTESIVSGDPFISEPTSSKKNAFRFELFSPSYSLHSRDSLVDMVQPSGIA
jgi:hypothetical protein